MKIYCPDIECDSCIKVISKTLEKSGINNFKINQDSIDLDSKGEEEKVLSLIREKGYRAGLEPFERKTFSERFRDFRQNKGKYVTEYKMLKYSALTFILLLVLEFIIYNLFFKSQPGFLQNYGWWIFYATLAVVSIGTSIWHIKSYVVKFTCMTGMMVGMTFGMQTGMMLGIILGATNGFFIGSVIGMIFAVGVGYYNGRIVGIMGVLEGMMAGVMGGVMGAMTGVMMRLDNILLFMPLFMFFNVSIMTGLSYMLFEEVVEHRPNVQKNKIKFLNFFFFCLIALLILSVLMIYGPKTGLARVI